MVECEDLAKAVPEFDMGELVINLGLYRLLSKLIDRKSVV